MNESTNSEEIGASVRAVVTPPDRYHQALAAKWAIGMTSDFPPPSALVEAGCDFLRALSVLDERLMQQGLGGSNFAGLVIEYFGPHYAADSVMDELGARVRGCGYFEKTCAATRGGSTSSIRRASRSAGET